jgi:PAS domain S-box-containing protein
MTLFTRLLLIIVVALLPPLAMQAFNETALRAARQADVRAQVEREARAVSGELAQITDGVRNTLVALAEVPGVRNGDPAECPALLKAVTARFGFLHDMALIGPDGVSRCDSAGTAPRERSDKPTIELSRRSGDFTVGDYAVDAEGRPVLPMAYPLPGKTGNVLVADFDLDRLRQLILAHGLPAGSAVGVSDREGRFLVRLPDTTQVGKLMMPQYMYLLHEAAPGVVEAVGPDGVRRIGGYVPSSVAPEHLFVSVGFSTQYAYAASEAATTRGYTLFGAGLLAALLLAAGLVRGTITRPVREILATTERWRAGDTSARVHIADKRSEFARIAGAVNDLLDSTVENQAGLRARLAELDAVYRGASVGLCFLDRDLRIVMSNAALTTINGISEAAHRGHTIRELLPTIADRVEPLLHRALAGEIIAPSETMGTTEAEPGIMRRLLVGYQPAIAPDGQVLGVVIAVQDITALRQVEWALQQTLMRANADLESRVAERTLALQAEVTEREAAQAQLQQAQKMELLGQLTGGVAHDFNNLLTAVIGNLELAMESAVDRPRTLRLLLNALRAADRGASLVQRMLAFGRRQHLLIESVQIADLLRGMEDLLARAIPPPVCVQIEAPEEMRAARADPNQVELVVLNLAVNARDAMPQGGTITILAQEETVGEGSAEAARLKPGRYVRITVRDTGTGMDPETQAHVFEPFFTTKPVGRGSGLGLSMVQGVAEQSGGAVDIKSALGQGTSVSVWLPCEGNETGAAPAPLSGALLMLVEDDADVRTATAASLTEAGYGVTTADSGEAALELLRVGPVPDLLIVDLGLDGIGGGTVIAEALRLAPSLPVLVATGAAGNVEAEMGYPVLHKPFRAADLRAKVADLLRLAA